MSWGYEGTLSPAIREQDRQTIEHLAPAIKGNKELRHRLKMASPSLRRDVYEMLLPYLKFKVLPFWALNK